VDGRFSFESAYVGGSFSRKVLVGEFSIAGKLDFPATITKLSEIK